MRITLAVLQELGATYQLPMHTTKQWPGQGFLALLLVLWCPRAEVPAQVLTVQADVVVGEDGRPVPPGGATHGDTHGAMNSLHILLLGESRTICQGWPSVPQLLQQTLRDHRHRSCPSQVCSAIPSWHPLLSPRVGALCWYFTFHCHLLQSTENYTGTQAASSNQILKE